MNITPLFTWSWSAVTLFIQELLISVSKDSLGNRVLISCNINVHYICRNNKERGK
jgi:hypothetical protein